MSSKNYEKDENFSSFEEWFDNLFFEGCGAYRDSVAVDEKDWVSEEQQNLLTGHHAKRFVRLYKGYFHELLLSIKRKYPHNSYVTHLNEENWVKFDLCPNNLSIVLKQMNANGGREFFQNDKQLYNEKIVSRILNFFKCKTVYNEIMTYNEDEFVLSVNFLKPTEKYFPLNSLESDVKIDLCNPIQKIMAALDAKMKTLSSILCEETKGKGIRYDMNKIKSEFLYMYIVHGLFLGDIDFEEKNMGYIYEEKSRRVRLGPSLDFEYCFMFNKSEEFKVALEYASKEYPEVFSKFVYYLELFSKRSFPLLKQNFEIIIERHIQNKNIANDYILILRDIVKHALNLCKEISAKQKN